MQLVSNPDTQIILSLSKSDGHMSNNHTLFIVTASRLIVSPILPDQ